MSEIYFSNFQLEENTEYFLYIGELKHFFKRSHDPHIQPEIRFHRHCPGYIRAIQL